MKRFLMCQPKFFEVRYVINPWMAGNQGKVDKVLAQQQWQNLHDIIAGLAAVSLIEQVVGLPDMVFTANAGIVRGNKAIVSSFRHAERQPETAYFGKYFAAQGYSVRYLRNETIFEGAGDALFDARGKLWFGSGIRSEPRALEEIKVALNAKGCEVEVTGLELVDPHWYHLDTAFCPLPQGQAIAYDKAFSRKSVAELNEAFGNNIVWVTEADAKNFACNAVSIDRAIVMHKVSAELKSALALRGFKIIEAEVSEFLKAGGACKCLTLEM